MINIFVDVKRIKHIQSRNVSNSSRKWSFGLHESLRWWASSSDTLIYPSIFAFPSLSLRRRSTPTHLRSDATALALARQLHSLYRTDLAYLMDIWLTIHMYLLLFLASPTCPLLRSDQSRGLAPRGQALSIASPYAHILVYHSYLTSLYLPFARDIIAEAPTICLYESPPKLRFRTHFALFRFASHCHDPTVSTSHNTPGDNPLPPDHTPSEPHRIYT